MRGGTGHYAKTLIGLFSLVGVANIAYSHLVGKKMVEIIPEINKIFVGLCKEKIQFLKTQL